MSKSGRGVIVGRRIVSGFRYAGAEQKKYESSVVKKPEVPAETPEMRAFLGMVHAEQLELAIEWSEKEDAPSIRTTMRDVQEAFLKVKDVLSRDSVMLCENFMWVLDRHFEFGGSNSGQVLVTVIALGKTGGNSGEGFAQVRAMGKIHILPVALLTLLPTARKS